MTTNTHIEQLLTQFKCESDIGILDKVFFDYGLREYFKKICEHYKVETFYGNFEAFSVIKRENIVRTTDLNFYKLCKKICLIYEGCVHIKCSYKEIQIGLLYAVMKAMGKQSFIFLIHDFVKDKNKISTEQLDELCWISSKDKLKNSSDLYMVLTDVDNMFVYWCEYLDIEITSKIKNHFSKMRSISEELCIDHIFLEIKKTSWKTRWAKLKAFNRDFYKLTEALRIKVINQVKGND